MKFSTLDDFVARAEARLDPVRGEERLSEGGDLDFVDRDQATRLRAAAVLIPIIPRPAGPTALLTQRPDTMASHPGQVAFPGGKVEDHDADTAEAALREASEEVGVNPEKVELVARSAPYITGTAYRITPVIGLLPSDFVARPDPSEVADVFETPLDFLFDTRNHRTGRAIYKGQERQYIEMPWQGFRIWGVTAGIINILHQNLYGPNSGEEG
ncbi:MAG: CoA pyrophosphatase [Henriciella sp.]|nr:CoA pyrophosphatase [Henriciella sp.]